MAELLGADAHNLGAKLAYRPWEQRGRPFDSPEVDWFAAEKVLHSAEREPKLELPEYHPASERGTVDSGGPANQG